MTIRKESRSSSSLCKTFFSDKAKTGLTDAIFLKTDDFILTDEYDVAERFNNYYVNIASTLNIDIDTELSYDVDEIVNKFKKHPSVSRIEQLVPINEEFSFVHVEPWDVYQVINDMDPKKVTSGPIPTKILKLVTREVCVPIAKCINLAIDIDIFPSELKFADVLPIHKGKDSFLPENYRPISILPAISKIFEKLLEKQMYTFMENKLSDLLCGFRKRHGTQHALFKLLQKWQQTLDSSKKVGTVLIDLSKAFDTLPHDLLPAKLKAYGFSKKSVKFLSSYLNHRFQRVKLSSVFSEWLEVILGVPQGSILGPLLFNIFINDLVFFIEKTDLCNFADDNTLSSCSQSLDEVIDSLQNDLSIALKWFKWNQLVANPNKFQVMFLGVSNPSNCDLVVAGKNLKHNNGVKLLGLWIDCNLNFDDHIQNICSAANRKINCLFRIRNLLSIDQAKTLSNTYILSNFRYCSQIWLFCSKTAEKLIQRTHKRCLRAVHGYSEESLPELLKRHGGETIHMTNLKTLMVEVYKSVNGINPKFMSTFFKNKHFSYSLRNSNLVSLPPIKTVKYGTNSLHFRSCFTWNRLPDNIKMSSNVDAFKNLLSSVKIVCNCHLCR